MYMKRSLVLISYTQHKKITYNNIKKDCKLNLDNKKKPY